MGYWTFFNGELNIELKKPYLQVLQSFLDKIFENENIIMVKEDSLVVSEDWKNGYGTMEDIVLFIQKFGKLNSGMIHCTGEEDQDVWEIIVRDNISWIKQYGYDVKNLKLSNIENLKAEIEEDGVRTYELETRGELTEEEQEYIEKIETYLEQFLNCETYSLNHFLKEAETGIETGVIKKIVFSFQECYFNWTKSCVEVNKLSVISEKENKLILHPYLAQFETEELFFSNAIIDLDDPRKVETDRGMLPLTELLMTPTFHFSGGRMEESHGENSIILENGKRVNPCDVCIKRLEKVTGGCKKCIPKRVNLKKTTQI